MPNYESHEITAEKLAKQLDYSRAVLKETFRLNPVSVGVGRITNTDLTLGGYNVPKGVTDFTTLIQLKRFKLESFDTKFILFFSDNSCYTEFYFVSIVETF